MDKYTLIRKLEGHHNDVVSCEFSPDGALLATASYDTRVIVWDHHKGTVLLELGYGTLQLSRKTKQNKKNNKFFSSLSPQLSFGDSSKVIGV